MHNAGIFIFKHACDGLPQNYNMYVTVTKLRTQNGTGHIVHKGALFPWRIELVGYDDRIQEIINSFSFMIRDIC